MTKSPDAFRSIGEVSRLVGVAPHVLRYWEGQFSQLSPVKRADGRRYYRPDDIRLVAGLCQVMREEGLSIRGAKRLIAEDKGAGLRQIGAARLQDLLPDGSAAAAATSAVRLAVPDQLDTALAPQPPQKAAPAPEPAFASVVQLPSDFAEVPSPPPSPAVVADQPPADSDANHEATEIAALSPTETDSHPVPPDSPSDSNRTDLAPRDASPSLPDPAAPQSSPSLAEPTPKTGHQPTPQAAAPDQTLSAPPLATAADDSAPDRPLEPANADALWLQRLTTLSDKIENRKHPLPDQARALRDRLKSAL